MFDYLINHCIEISFFVIFSVFGYIEYKAFLERKKLTTSEFLKSIKPQLEKAGRSVLAKIATSFVVALLISNLFFRDFWSNDAFHTVLLASLILDPIHAHLRKLFE